MDPFSDAEFSLTYNSCFCVWLGVWSVAKSAKRIPSVAEGREDVCLVALGHCRSGATNFEWTGGKVSSFLSNRLLCSDIFLVKKKMWHEGTAH